MQVLGQTESIQFNLDSFKLVHFDITDLRYRRQAVRKIARSLTLHQLQDCNQNDPSLDLFSDSSDLGMKDIGEICRHLSQSNLKSPGDLIRKACLSDANLQLFCCQATYSTKKAFQDLLLDPLQTIEPDVGSIARKHVYQLNSYNKLRTNTLRQDRPGHFVTVDFNVAIKTDPSALSNPLTILTTMKSDQTTKVNLTKVRFKCEPTSFEVFGQISAAIQSQMNGVENLWICTRDEAVAGKIIKEFSKQNPLAPKFLKAFDRSAPILLLHEILKSDQPTKHLILSWDYLDECEIFKI